MSVRRQGPAVPAARAATALLIAAALGLAGCDARDSGEESGAGAPQIDANGNVVAGNPDGAPDLGAALAEPPTFQLFSDETDLETGGADTAVITATLIDSGRNPVAGEAVSWSASAGVLQDIVDTTDGNGAATAALRMPQSYRNVDVEVTVTAGESSETIVVRAYGTELDVQGLQKSVVAGEELEATLTLTAGDGEPIANRPVRVESAIGNTIEPAEPVTDANGVATVRIGSAAGADTITVGALDDESLTQRFEFGVSADRLEFSTASGETVFPVDSTGEVSVRWTSGGAPVAFRDLRVSTTAGTINTTPTVTTDADGRVTLPISSSAAGEARITVEDLDGDPVSDFGIAFVATTPALLDVGATSTRVYVDGSSQITALVRDANGNPVAGEEVAFSSASLSGGQLSPAATVTNEEGRATTTFRAGSIATEIDAIEVTAVTGGTPAFTDSVRLSVVERRLNVSIGRGSKLEEDALQTRNERNMIVQVADGSGAALADAEVALSIAPMSYSKGELVAVNEAGVPAAFGDENWTPDFWAVVHDDADTFVTECMAEDALSLNRSIDPLEDINGNGRLDPQDPAVLAPVESGDVATLDAGGTLFTAADGTGYFRLVYPKGNANWVTVRVTARASHLGTEAQDSLIMTLPSIAGDVDFDNGEPPNFLSPYGQELDCTSPR